MVNRCFMCKMSAETCNHLLLWCPMVYSLWNMIYELLGINWVVAGSVRDEIYSPIPYPSIDLLDDVEGKKCKSIRWN